MFIEVTTIADLVDSRAAVHDHDALVMPDSRLTYPELAEGSDGYAAALLALGVRPGDKVGLLMPNNVDFVLGIIAAAKLGAVAVPINGRFKARECTHVLAHGDVKVLLLGSDPRGTDFADLVCRVLPGLEGADPRNVAQPEAPELRTVVAMNGEGRGFISRTEFLDGAIEANLNKVKQYQQRVRVRDVAILMYTSGTTATPKGCLLSHEAIVRQARNVAENRFALTENDALWDPLPLFHCGGIVPMLGCFSIGAKFCHAGFFEPGQALQTIEQERCTVLYPAFETIWLAVLDHPDFANTDLSAVRLVQNIATPERLAQFEARMPTAAQVSSYGSTECASNLTMALQDDPYEVRINTLGKPVDGMEIKIVDPESGEEVPASTMGELCFRGYSSFDGYYKDPAQTATAIDDARWFHTGDRAMIDADGNLIYGGRLKDMLKVGGENVAAVEIEDFLARLPDINIVQVVAAPDARYGEVPAAFVQRSPGSTIGEQEIIDACIGEISSFKIPRYVRFVDEWPMSGTKIQKFALREDIAKELADRGITEAPKVNSAC